MDYEARDESVVGDSFRQIGADVNSARLAKGIQISELSQLLRISKHQLKSIEAGDFDSLPGPTYVAGYLRSFAQEVGLDGAALAQRYRALLGEREKGPTYSFPVDTQRPQRSGAMLASIIVILAVAGYGVWYAVGRPDVLTAMTGEAQSETIAPPQIELTATEPDDMAKPDIEPVDLAAVALPVTDPAMSGAASDSAGTDTVGTDTVGTDTVGTTIAGVPGKTAVAAGVVSASETGLAAVQAFDSVAVTAAKQEAPDQVLPDITIPDITTPDIATPDIATLADTPADNMPAAGTSGGAADLAAVDGAIEGVLTPLPGDEVADRQLDDTAPVSMDSMTGSISGQIGTGVAFARQRVPDMELTLRATSASWVEIIRNDGEEVMTKLMRAGDTYVIDSRDRLYLSTGNAGGLELLFNDGTVRSVGESGEILRDLLLDASKLRNQL
jgi:cytoskeleton protein RodZ